MLTYTNRDLNIVFVLCLIGIFALSIYIYSFATKFYNRLDETMQNNVNLNIEIKKNEHMNHVHDLIEERLQEVEEDVLE